MHLAGRAAARTACIILILLNEEIKVAFKDFEDTVHKRIT